MKEAAEVATQNREEVLACEWFSKRRIFGTHASINEMAKFKSKIRKSEEIDGKKVEKKADL